jgi:hypothetical protein
MGIKRRRILCWFKKYKHTLVTKCTKKGYSRKKIFVCTQGAPCVVDFFTKLCLNFWNLLKFLRFFFPMKSILLKQILDPYIVHDPKSRDQRWSGHWDNKFLFVAISILLDGTGTVCTVSNLRGTFVENVNKSKINPPRCPRVTKNHVQWGITSILILLCYVYKYLFQ